MWINYNSTTQPTKFLHCVLNNMKACVSPRKLHNWLSNLHISAAMMNPHLKSTLERVTHACESGFKSQSLLNEEVLCIHLCFHSCIHSDTRCHLKVNSERNQFDKLLLFLSLNRFGLEIDTGAAAIHLGLRAVGTLRENSRASVWSTKRENEMGVIVQWVKTGVRCGRRGER